jgi:hypothetical protein
MLGGSLVVEITPNVVKRYQADRLKEKAGPKTINDEVQLLLRLCGQQGVLIRATLRRDKALKLPLPPSPGRPYGTEEKARMLEEAAKSRTPQMHAALALDLNTGLRDKELREIRWEQIDLVHRRALTVGKSNTQAGTGRVIPLNETAIAALEAHAAWYTRRFGECRPEWFVFAFGAPLPKDPTRPITSFKTAWIKVRKKAGVKGRWHDPTGESDRWSSGGPAEGTKQMLGNHSPDLLLRWGFPYRGRVWGGARVFGVMTAAGADPETGMRYAKIIGEKEKAVESAKFDFLGIYRPVVILGNAKTPTVLSYVIPLLDWAMPSKYHSIHKNDLARAMVAQSEQALIAILQGTAPKEATVKILE